MAGYDFEFEVPKRYRAVAQQWMKSFKRLARGYNLDVHYSTKITGRGQAQINATVDGSLYAIQHLYRRLVGEVARYAMMNDQTSEMRKYILPKFILAHRESVYQITDDISRLSDMLESYNFVDVTPLSDLSVSKNLLARAEGRRTRLNRAIQTIIQTMDKWSVAELSGEDAVILCDQGMENWLKALMEVPLSSRDGFRDVLDKAIGKGIISRMEAYRLRRFHKTRNRVQHRGGRVRPKTLFSMLSYCSKLVDQKTSD